MGAYNKAFLNLCPLLKSYNNLSKGGGGLGNNVNWLSVLINPINYVIYNQDNITDFLKLLVIFEKLAQEWSLYFTSNIFSATRETDKKFMVLVLRILWMKLCWWSYSK